MRTEPKHQQQQHHHQLQHIGTFLPMLCSKPSMIKNVHIPNPFNNKNNHHSSSNIHPSTLQDPSLSPKVGCMGQVKKKDYDHHHQHQHHNNYNLCLVFPTTTTTTTSYTIKTTEAGDDPIFGSVSCSSYSKLLSLFSSKTHHHHHQQQQQQQKKISSSRSVSGVRNCRMMRSRSYCDDDSYGGGSVVIGFGSPIDLADMDPPLPVLIKRKTLTTSTSSITSLISEGDNNNNNKMNNSSLWKRRLGGRALKSLEIQQVHIPIQSITTTSTSI